MSRYWIRSLRRRIAGCVDLKQRAQLEHSLAVELEITRAGERNDPRIQERKKQRRQRERLADGFYTVRDLRVLWQLQGGRCYFSGVALGSAFHERAFSVDHLVPLISYGSNWPINLALVTERVNRLKCHLSVAGFVRRSRLRSARIHLTGEVWRRRVDEQRERLFGHQPAISDVFRIISEL